MNNNDVKTQLSDAASDDKEKLKSFENLIQTMNRLALPSEFIEWQSKSRLRMFTRLQQAGAGAVHSQPAHLPVVATLGDGNFPINLASRGIGLLPKQEMIKKYIDLINGARNQSAEKEMDASLFLRVNAIREFYENIEEIDPMILGGLEIFEGKTFTNIQENQFVSILYSGEPPKYPSYQFNCIAEILLPEDIRFKFLLAARELFAFESFHITQIRYPFGYAFHPVDIIDKTPFPRR